MIRATLLAAVTLVAAAGQDDAHVTPDRPFAGSPTSGSLCFRISPDFRHETRVAEWSPARFTRDGVPA